MESHAAGSGLTLWRPRWANCLVWAWVMWHRHGGHLVLTHSAYGWWPHAQWSPDLLVHYEFRPYERRRRRRWWEVPLLFSGYPALIQRGVT